MFCVFFLLLCGLDFGTVIKECNECFPPKPAERVCVCVPSSEIPSESIFKALCVHGASNSRVRSSRADADRLHVSDERQKRSAVFSDSADSLPGLISAVMRRHVVIESYPG